MNLLLPLFLNFVLMSFMSIGGANSALPEIHRLVVDSQHWLSDDQFTALFALSQVAPGPNIMVVTLIGWQLAGIWGALATTVGMMGPSSLLACAFYRVWQKWPPAQWRKAIHMGLAPITIGLVLSSGFLIAKASGHTRYGYLVTLTTIVLALRTRVNPLWFLGAAAILGACNLL